MELFDVLQRVYVSLPCVSCSQDRPRINCDLTRTVFYDCRYSEYKLTNLSLVNAYSITLCMATCKLFCTEAVSLIGHSSKELIGS